MTCVAYLNYEYLEILIRKVGGGGSGAERVEVF